MEDLAISVLNIKNRTNKI